MQRPYWPGLCLPRIAGGVVVEVYRATVEVDATTPIICSGVTADAGIVVEVHRANVGVDATTILSSSVGVSWGVANNIRIAFKFYRPALDSGGTPVQ